MCELTGHNLPKKVNRIKFIWHKLHLFYSCFLSEILTLVQWQHHAVPELLGQHPGSLSNAYCSAFFGPIAAPCCTRAARTASTAVYFFMRCLLWSDGSTVLYQDSIYRFFFFKCLLLYYAYFGPMAAPCCTRAARTASGVFGCTAPNILFFSFL